MFSLDELSKHKANVLLYRLHIEHRYSIVCTRRGTDIVVAQCERPPDQFT